MANVAIQFFSFDNSRKALDLIRGADPVVEYLPKRKFLFQSLNGSRRSITVSKLLDGATNEIHFNEGYLQTPVEYIRHDGPLGSIQKLFVHFSVSPSSELWRSSSEVEGTPAAAHVFARNVASTERAAKNRSPHLMPTVLEITLCTDRTDVPTLIKEASEIVDQAWPLIRSRDKSAAIDVGGEWLFFPKSGYNPNVSDLHIYYCVDSFQSWQTTRTRHNVSFASSDQSGLRAEATIYSTAPRERSHS